MNRHIPLGTGTYPAPRGCALRDAAPRATSTRAPGLRPPKTGRWRSRAGHRSVSKAGTEAAVSAAGGVHVGISFIRREREDLCSQVLSLDMQGDRLGFFFYFVTHLPPSLSRNLRRDVQTCSLASVQ